jgi:hypothetical protein
MSDILYAPFDSETGARTPEEGDLLTFYMAIMDKDFKLVDEIDLKLKPDDRLPIAQEEALKVNGIDIKKHLEDPNTVTYSKGRELFTAFLAKHHKKVGRFNNLRPLGYNVPFDEGYAWYYLLPRPEWNKFFHYKRIDVMERVDFLKESGWFPSNLGTLGTVVDYLQIPKRNAHNAKEDTFMCVDVYKKILEIMKAKKEGGVAQDLISLLEAE